MEKDSTLLSTAIETVYAKRAQYIAAMEQSQQGNGVDQVIAVLREVVDSQKK